VADLNGDGLPDIVVANRYGNSGGSNYVCLNRGHGKFDADCTAFSHESATTITPADFNGDGFIDLLAPNRDGEPIFPSAFPSGHPTRPYGWRRRRT
jgi:hypothetical protein